MRALRRAGALLLVLGLITMAQPAVSAADDAGDERRVRPPDAPWVSPPESGGGVRAAAMSDGPYSVSPDGTVTADNWATHHGDVRGLELWQPVIGIARTPTFGGYWLAARDSGVFSFGDARYHGNLIDALVARDLLPPGTLNGSNILEYLDGEIVDIAGSAPRQGYWLLGADGGVFNFGAAGFAGAPAGQLDPNWQHLARTIRPYPGGYTVTVFLYAPDALAGADGSVDGILQRWLCTGSCALQGQAEAREVVPGVEQAPPPPPPAAAPDFAGQYLNIITPMACASQHLDRAWAQIDPEDDGFLYWEWPIVQQRVLPWMVKVSDEMHAAAERMGQVPWPADLVQDVEAYRVVLVKHAFVIGSYGRAQSFDDLYWLGVEFAGYESYVGTYHLIMLDALGIPDGLDYCA